MLDETRRMGLPGPQFRETSEFVVTFEKAAALSAPPARPQPQATLWGEQEPRPSDLSVPEALDAFEGRLIKAMQYVHEHGFITNGLYRELTGASERTATRDLDLLVERGRLRSLGKRRARRYVLA